MKWLASICGAPVNDTDSVSHYWRTWRPVGSRGLDWMNFFISDVQEGFGAFVAFHLADQKWSQGSIGEMLTIGRAASALSLISGGG
jgi:hypothetical protein